MVSTSRACRTQKVDLGLNPDKNEWLQTRIEVARKPLVELPANMASGVVQAEAVLYSEAKHPERKLAHKASELAYRALLLRITETVPECRVLPDDAPAVTLPRPSLQATTSCSQSETERAPPSDSSVADGLALVFELLFRFSELLLRGLG